MPHPDTTGAAVEAEWVTQDRASVADNGRVQLVLSGNGEGVKYVVDYQLIVCIFSNHFNSSLFDFSQRFV